MNIEDAYIMLYNMYVLKNTYIYIYNHILYTKYVIYYMHICYVTCT